MGGIHALCLLRRCTEKNTWLLPKMQNLNLIMRETSDKGTLRDIPGSNRPAFFSINVTKGKERLKNCSRLEEAAEM